MTDAQQREAACQFYDRRNGGEREDGSVDWLIKLGQEKACWRNNEKYGEDARSGTIMKAPRLSYESPPGRTTNCNLSVGVKLTRRPLHPVQDIFPLRSIGRSTVQCHSP